MKIWIAYLLTISTGTSLAGPASTTLVRTPRGVTGAEGQLGVGQGGVVMGGMGGPQVGYVQQPGRGETAFTSEFQNCPLAPNPDTNLNRTVSQAIGTLQSLDDQCQQSLGISADAVDPLLSGLPDRIAQQQTVNGITNVNCSNYEMVLPREFQLALRFLDLRDFQAIDATNYNDCYDGRNQNSESIARCMSQSYTQMTARWREQCTSQSALQAEEATREAQLETVARLSSGIADALARSRNGLPPGCQPGSMSTILQSTLSLLGASASYGLGGLPGVALANILPSISQIVSGFGGGGQLRGALNDIENRTALMGLQCLQLSLVNANFECDIRNSTADRATQNICPFPTTPFSRQVREIGEIADALGSSDVRAPFDANEHMERLERALEVPTGNQTRTHQELRNVQVALENAGTTSLNLPRATRARMADQATILKRFLDAYDSYRNAVPTADVTGFRDQMLSILGRRSESAGQNAQAPSILKLERTLEAYNDLANSDGRDAIEPFDWVNGIAIESALNHEQRSVAMAAADAELARATLSTFNNHLRNDFRGRLRLLGSRDRANHPTDSGVRRTSFETLLGTCMLNATMFLTRPDDSRQSFRIDDPAARSSDSEFRENCTQNFSCIFRGPTGSELSDPEVFKDYQCGLIRDYPIALARLRTALQGNNFTNACPAAP